MLLRRTVVAVWVLLTFGCGGDDPLKSGQTLVGSWRNQRDGEILSFNSGGTFSWSFTVARNTSSFPFIVYIDTAADGTYSVSTNRVILTSTSTYGFEISGSWEFTLTGDTLTMTSEDGDVRSFQRLQ